MIPPNESHSSFSYAIATFETTLNNIQFIRLPDTPHEVTSFRNSYEEIIITATPKINSDIKADLINIQYKMVTIQIAIKFKFRVVKKMYDKAII
jgi:precorrin-6B methylase 1